MATPGTVTRVSKAELEYVLGQMKTTGVEQLVIVGPEVNVRLCAEKRLWPFAFDGSQVYQLIEVVGTLAKQIVRLTQLKKLMVWAVGLDAGGVRAIAERLGDLTALDIRANGIGEAGARAIAKHLGQLTSLGIAENHVGVMGARALAEHLGQLSSLDVGHNHIGDEGVRAIAERLGQLTCLSVDGNFIGKAGARAITERLSQLRSLDIGSNGIGEGGTQAIAQHLGQLTSLAIGGNGIGEGGMQAIAEHLSQLTSLAVGGNFIGSHGAQSIARYLGKLVSLDIGFNNIGDRGARLIAEHLGQLTSLDVSSNDIRTEGARAIAEHLGQLRSLDVSSNDVRDVGVSFIAEHLKQLTFLDVGFNDIGDMAVTSIANRLTSLKQLDVRYNKQIQNVEYLAQLSSLQRLDIRGTSVSDLSFFATQVLAGLPISLSEHNSFFGILVNDCPLKHPSQEIISQGQEAVRNFFREIEEQGVDRLYEAKVLILGEGEAGKTSLLRRLYLPTLPLPSVDEDTRGINVHRQDFEMEDGRTFRLNVWDFGGQQIYHATHQFFLTTSSLYLLVDNTKKNHKSIHDEGFKFWLEVVETLSDSSPLLIFQNEKGGRSKMIDEAGIRGRFPNFKEIYRGNLDDPRATDRVRQAIQFYVQQLPHVGKAVPAKWVTIRKAIEEEAVRRPFISQDEYFDIYRRHLEFDRTKALYLSQTLHNLGVFLHFQDDPLLSKVVILQNQWATEAVFRVLDDEMVKEAKGHFAVSDCRRLWAEPHYADVHLEMLGLMEKFELCYRLPDMHPWAWLAPRLLPPSKPAELVDWATPQDLVVRFRYTFLPRGLVSRLIVRQHRFIKQVELSWEHGAFFEKEATQVLVEETVQGNEIELRSRGPEGMALLSVLVNELEALNDTFKSLKGKVEKLVPCICEQCRQSTSPVMHEQADLVRRKQHNKLTIECRQSYTNVSVVELLDGLWPKDVPDWAKVVRRPSMSEEESYARPIGVVSHTPTPIERTIRIFLASSSELKDERDEFDLYLRQQNDRLRRDGLYLKIERWENFLGAMLETRLQDEYNKAVQACDIFISLFMTKTGKYTEEEFDLAHQAFKRNKKPLIYTYFKKATISVGDDNRNDLLSLWKFKDKLRDLGHYHTVYDGIEHLKRQFMDQLNMLRDEARL